MKTPIYKKWWFWVLAIIVIAALGNNKEEKKEDADTAITAPTTVPTTVPTNPLATKTDATSKPTPAPSMAATEPTPKVDEAVAKPAEEIPGTIGMTPEEFRKSFNERADSMGSKIKISKKLTVETGPVQDSFQYMFTDFLGLTGSVNKADGSIRDVMMIGRGDGTASSGANVIVVMGLVILSVNPDLPSNEVGSILSDLHVLDDGVDLTKIDESTIRNGIQYHVSGSDVIGLMFSAGDANDK